MGDNLILTPNELQFKNNDIIKNTIFCGDDGKLIISASDNDTSTEVRGDLNVTGDLDVNNITSSVNTITLGSSNVATSVEGDLTVVGNLDLNTITSSTSNVITFGNNSGTKILIDSNGLRFKQTMLEYDFAVSDTAIFGSDKFELKKYDPTIDTYSSISSSNGYLDNDSQYLIITDNADNFNALSLNCFFYKATFKLTENTTTFLCSLGIETFKIILYCLNLDTEPIFALQMYSGSSKCYS